MKLTIYSGSGAGGYEFETVDEEGSFEAQNELLMARPNFYVDSLADESDVDALVAGEFCADIKLASISGVPEFKTTWEKQCTGPKWAKVCVKVPVLWVRTSRQAFILKVCVNSKPALSAVRKCVVSAGIAGLVTSYFASPKLAVPVIKLELTRCLIEKGEKAAAKSLSVRTRVASESGEWKRKS